MSCIIGAIGFILEEGAGYKYYVRSDRYRFSCGKKVMWFATECFDEFNEFDDKGKKQILKALDPFVKEMYTFVAKRVRVR